MKDLKKKSLSELKQLLHKYYDGNSGEILNAFRELNISSEKKLKESIIRYLERVPVDDVEEIDK